ncbi:MAG TPA: extracellular solute-binding protein [Ktedonobacterales bacterium]|nr:extracellular solute-binding protein [Ktedonobacterales bacterium]
MSTFSPQEPSDDIIARAATGRLSRRTFLVRAGALALSAGAAASLLAACGGSTTGTDTVTVVAGDNQFWPTVQTYNTANPHLKVTTIVSAWGNGGQDMKEKELVLMSGGTFPNLAQMVWLKEFAREGLLLDLTDTAKSWDVYPHLNSAQIARMSYNGRIYGLTLGNNTVFQYYNKDILARVGMTGPLTTLDQVQELASKILAARLTTAHGNPIYTTAFDGGNWATDYWLWAGGGSQMNDDYTQTLIDSPASIAAYATMQNLVKSGAAPKPDGTSLQLWLNGQIAMYISGEWDALATAQAKLNYGTAVMPKGPTGLNTTSIGGVEYAILKKSSNQDAALSLLKAAASSTYQTDTNPHVIDYFSDLSDYANPAKQAAWNSQGPGVAQSRLVTADQLQSSRYNFLEAPYVFPDAATIYNDALQQVLVQLADPATVMKSAASQINQGISGAVNS